MAMSNSVITILSGKAGCGKTILALNLAIVLGNNDVSRVCVVDLDLARGDIASGLGLTGGPSLIAAMTDDGHLDSRRLTSLITPYITRVDCLLAPTQPGESEKISAHFIEELLAALRSHYDYVVIDTPAETSSRVLAGLDSSDHHILLTTPEIPSVHKGRLALDILDLIADRATSRSVVVNRADAAGGLTQTQIEQVVRAPIAALLPSSSRVERSINEQVPLARSHPDHPFVTAVREFASVHIATPGP
jgi:pilus assembly protein CpaE